MARWNSADHPRYPNGKFRPKFSQSVRLSPISVSYNAGVRIPIVPGRANLYLGALARVERSGRSGGIFQRKIDAAVNSVSARLGDVGGRSNLAQLLKGNEINTKSGFKVRGARLAVSQPTFRVSRNANTVDQGLELRERPRARQARRPRTTTRTPNTTVGIRTAKPKAITKGPRRVRKSSARGRRVRR